jgi:predicted pyridoxine 5'-phosphate oxidase superfamily flavin-nucleotide-binding protein
MVPSFTFHEIASSLRRIEQWQRSNRNKAKKQNEIRDQRPVYQPSSSRLNMAGKFLELAFTPAVRAAQGKYFGRAQQIPPQAKRDALTDDEIQFIRLRDSFYLATVSETGWPYVQHRGGRPGFLRLVSPTQLAFADYKGNRQMLSTGNLAINDRVCLFLMDYPQQTRLKILGHARVLDAREHPDLVAQIAEPETRGLVERLFLIEVISFDWNCPKYITPRYTATEVEETVAPLKARIAELEAQLHAGK